MLKTVGFVALWLTGSSAAVAVAWTGVAIVDNELVAPAPADSITSPLGGEQAEVDLSDTQGASTATARITGEPSSNPTADEGSELGTDPSSGRAERRTASTQSDPTSDGSEPPPQPTVRVSTTSSPTTAVSSTTSKQPTTNTLSTTVTTTAATASTTVLPTTTRPPSTTQATAPPTQVLTFTMVGGTTAIAFSSASVDVLWATPNPGFEVRIEPESSGIKVEFRADHHRSRIDAWWSSGPQHEIREEPDN